MSKPATLHRLREWTHTLHTLHITYYILHIQWTRTFHIMCVCVCVCVLHTTHTNIHIQIRYVYAYIYIYIYICGYIDIHACTYICIYRHIYTRMYVYICICIHMYIYTNVYIYIHIHKYPYSYTYTYTYRYIIHIHLYIHICVYICIYIHIYTWNMGIRNIYVYDIEPDKAVSKFSKVSDPVSCLHKLNRGLPIEIFNLQFHLRKQHGYRDTQNKSGMSRERHTRRELTFENVSRERDTQR
jgi:hypothetical protein